MLREGGPFTRRQRFCGFLMRPCRRMGCDPLGRESWASSAQPSLLGLEGAAGTETGLEKQQGNASRRAGNHWGSSLAYYFHHHHSLARSENLWGARDCEISVNSQIRVHYGWALRARTQVTTMLVATVDKNFLYLLENHQRVGGAGSL